MNQVNPHNMTKPELRKWAKDLCDQWNWNAGTMDIVEQLQAEGIQSDSREFEVLSKEFNKFFNNPKVPHIEIIKELLEHDE
jgi:hypothetical protein